MKLTKIEQETIVLFNEQEDTAEIYTHNIKLQNRCKSFAEKHPELVTVRGSTFVVPKKLLSIVIRSPMSEELREQHRQRGLKNNYVEKARCVAREKGKSTPA